MAAAPVLPPGRGGLGRPAARRVSRSAVVCLLMIAAAVWRCCSVVGAGFVAGLPSPGPLSAGSCSRGGSRRGLERHAAAFTFDIAASDNYANLVRKDEETGIHISTHGGMMTGNWNTVLGDKEFPPTGRSYYEVKFVSKPSDAWEYIGVAEATADVTVPLTRNKKGAGWFWGANWHDSYVYTYLEMRKEFSDFMDGRVKELTEIAVRQTKTGFTEKESTAQLKAQLGGLYKGVKGIHVGGSPGLFPTFKTGMVIGVDVDMDKGTLSFWADGKFLGPVRDETSRPLNIKGKKLVPAMSVFGRTTGRHNEYTTMEVRTGLMPPPMPTAA